MSRIVRLGAGLLRGLPPEAAHRAGLHALRAGYRLGLMGPPPVPSPRLEQSVFGLPFPHPLGLAAGFDKQAEAITSLFGLGFAFLEVGGVTLRPQPGNPRPRLFRLAEDRAVINRFGLNSIGAARLLRRLTDVPHPRTGPLAINIAPGKDCPDPGAEIAELLDVLAAQVDMFVINASSPNTPGLRDLQFGPALRRLLRAVEAGRRAASVRRPALLKLAPDLPPETIPAIADAVLEAGIDGLVLTNTTLSRPAGLRSRHAHQTGGLSGDPLRPLANQVLARFARRLRSKLPLIGLGGVMTADDVYEKIRLGATLVQSYTGFAYRGTDLIEETLRLLPERLDRDGFPTLAAAVGSR